MSILSELKADLTQVSTFKTIAETFVEINALKIKRIRAEFDKNRRFFSEITRLYHTIKQSAARKNMKLVLPEGGKKTKKAKGTATELTASKRVLLVAVTSNSRFYGALNQKVVEAYFQEIQSRPADPSRRGRGEIDFLVIGQSGADSLKILAKNLPFKSLKFKKETARAAEIESFTAETLSYDEIRVYYPKFLTILSQEPSVVDITQSAGSALSPLERDGSALGSKVGAPMVIENLFEPELNKIVTFFENQIRTLLFKRVLLETELSKTAARLMAMNEAAFRSQALVKKKRGELLKEERSISNNQLLEVFSGVRNWRS